MRKELQHNVLTFLSHLDKVSRKMLQRKSSPRITTHNQKLDTLLKILHKAFRCTHEHKGIESADHEENLHKILKEEHSHTTLDQHNVLTDSIENTQEIHPDRFEEYHQKLLKKYYKKA